ncbi:MAG: ATP-binding protein [Deltaproteobacteria bacterium]|nr:ATP-binding protein [Deltaproteobacteria bacterium]
MKRTYLAAVLRTGLAIFLLISSAAIVYTTSRNFRSVRLLSTRALESTALALSSSAETALRAMGNKADTEIREILSDRVVAYAMITTREGKILFHTNPDLAGCYLSSEKKMEWPSTTASGKRINLRTGLPAYEFNFILHLPDGPAQLLRLVLYTTPADRVISDARKMWWTVGIILILLWTGGVMLERVFTRQLDLQDDLERRNQLALIGQMTAVLAHEIRNALGSIKGYVQWVHEKLEKPDPKKEGLAVVLQGVERIESLTNDLLCFSRKEQYRIEPLEPVSLISEAINAAAPSWKGKVELAARPEIRLMGDREKLYRVFLNGIRNAVQAMKEEGSLRISVSADGRWVKIRIEDTGAGIPAEEIPRLFTPFHTTKADGTGLGLAYSRKLVQGMGGRIDLANREDETGAVLTIQLPKGRCK